jgi:hypothetical protein
MVAVLQKEETYFVAPLQDLSTLLVVAIEYISQPGLDLQGKVFDRDSGSTSRGCENCKKQTYSQRASSNHVRLCRFVLSFPVVRQFVQPISKDITSKVLDISGESLIPNVTYLEAGSMEILLFISFRGRNRKQKLANSSLAKVDGKPEINELTQIQLSCLKPEGSMLLLSPMTT